VTPLALVFDFDDTLVPDSSSWFLERQGIVPGDFWSGPVAQRINEGWDPVPAYLYEIKLLGESRGKPFTREDFVEAGSTLSYHPGVKSFFRNIQQDLAELQPEAEVEFYLISSGMGDVVRSSSIAKYFRDIWSCDWHYKPDGTVDFPRRIVSFTDKTRYVYQISKGMVGPEYKNRPFDVNMRTENLRIPMVRFVSVGDGLTDVPVFSLLQKNGGTAFAVYDPQHGNRRKAWGFVQERRVQGVLAPKYNRGSDLYQNILMALEAAAQR